MDLYVNTPGKTKKTSDFIKLLAGNGYKPSSNLAHPTWKNKGNMECIHIWPDKLVSYNSPDHKDFALDLIKDYDRILNRLGINIKQEKSKTMKVEYNTIITPDSVTIFVGSKPFVARKDHVNFTRIKNLLKRRRFSDAIKLFDVIKAIEKRSKGKIAVKNNVVYWDSKPLHNYVTGRILALLKEGFDTKPIINFLEDLYNNNPLVKEDKNCYLVEDLYKFLEVNNLPCTTDGGFLAWKRVRKDGNDIHSNTINYKVGEYVEENFDRVDKNRDNVCSHGLHFAADSYYKQSGFGDGDSKTLLVKVMPSWVCSIPTDYNNSKGRAYKMFVYAEYDDNCSIDLKKSVVSSKNGPKRDKFGRFSS